MIEQNLSQPLGIKSTLSAWLLVAAVVTLLAGLAAPPPVGGSFMWETWSCVGLGSHTPSHIGAVAPGLVWVRAGHHSLVMVRVARPREHSPRSESKTVATSGRGPRRHEVNT